MNETRTLSQSIRAGDTITIVTAQGKQLKGRAVMPCSAGGWVLNLGGRHGTPGIADDSNTIKVSKSRASAAITGGSGYEVAR